MQERADSARHIGHQFYLGCSDEKNKTMCISNRTAAAAAARFWHEGRVTSLRFLGRAMLGCWIARAWAAGPAHLPRLGAVHGGLLLRLPLRLMHRSCDR